LGGPFTIVVIAIYFWKHINNRPGECWYLFGFRPLTIVVCQLAKEGLLCTVSGGVTNNNKIYPKTLAKESTLSEGVGANQSHIKLKVLIRNSTAVRRKVRNLFY
jgi:hypothetical protein